MMESQQPAWGWRAQITNDWRALVKSPWPRYTYNADKIGCKDSVDRRPVCPLVPPAGFTRPRHALDVNFLHSNLLIYRFRLLCQRLPLLCPRYLAAILAQHSYVTVNTVSILAENDVPTAGLRPNGPRGMDMISITTRIHPHIMPTCFRGSSRSDAWQLALTLRYGQHTWPGLF